MKEYPSSDVERKKRRDVDSQNMPYDVVGSGSNKSKFQLGVYDACFWNNADTVRDNNCYAYACNIRVDKVPTNYEPNYPDPGYRHFGRKVNNAGEFKEGILHDGLVEINGPGATTRVIGTDENPVWIVAAFTAEGRTESGEHVFGYHFFRKVWSGEKDNSGKGCGDGGQFCSWGHKFAGGKVTNLSKDNTPITSPEEEMDRLNKSSNLQYFLVGYFLVKPDVVIGAQF